MKYLLIIFILITCFGFAKLSKDKKITSEISDKQNIYKFSLTDIEGNEYNFENLKNKVLLLVNVASKCGFTNQYEELEKLYNLYKSEGLIVIGIPSNDFGNQEPGKNKEIEQFCKTNYKITFPLMSKISVKGKNIDPLYSYLTNKKVHPKTGGPISWNFNKFLVSYNGEVTERYSSFTKPLSKKIKQDIEKLLKELKDV